jgi:poly(hydroxyalkanoate) depolymerase family esterase
MAKGLTGLWLRGLARAAKAQQARNKKMLKLVLATPKPKRARKTAPAKRPASAQENTRARSARNGTVRSATDGTTTRSRTLAKAPSTTLRGKWLRSYYASAESGAAPGRRMSYWLYLPSTPAGEPMPLLVMLHGCQQTATQFADGTRMNRLAEEKGFAVLYPQQSVRGHPNRCWHWYERNTQHGGDDVKLIVGVIGKVMESYSVDRRRVYLAGLSAGAAMANIIALNHPHLIAAVGLHSGTIFGAGHSRLGALSVMQLGSSRSPLPAIDEAANRSTPFPIMPAILIHGQQDSVVRPINLTQLTHQFSHLNGLRPEEQRQPVVKRAKSGSAPEHAYRLRDFYAGKTLVLRECEVHNLDHAWSGGDCTIKFNDCSGPDASRMMWDFFARHRR